MRTELLKRCRRRFDTNFDTDINRWHVFDKKKKRSLLLEETHTAVYLMGLTLLSREDIALWVEKIERIHKSWK